MRYECPKCGQKTKTKQGLHGHIQFKHSDFIKIRMPKNKVERIKIGDKVVKTTELAIDLDVAVKLKEKALEWEMSIEEVVDDLISTEKNFVELEDMTTDQVYTPCIECKLEFWAYSKHVLGNAPFYCTHCSKAQVWKQ